MSGTRTELNLIPQSPTALAIGPQTALCEAGHGFERIVARRREANPKRTVPEESTGTDSLWETYTAPE